MMLSFVNDVLLVTTCIKSREESRSNKITQPVNLKVLNWNLLCSRV